MCVLLIWEKRDIFLKKDNNGRPFEYNLGVFRTYGRDVAFSVGLEGMLGNEQENAPGDHQGEEAGITGACFFVDPNSIGKSITAFSQAVKGSGETDRPLFESQRFPYHCSPAQ